MEHSHSEQHSNNDIERLITGRQWNVKANPEHRVTLREQVLAEFDRASANSSSAASKVLFLNLWRWIMARPISRLGIPAVLVAAMAAVAFTLFPAKAGFALEKIVEPLLVAKSGRCQVMVQMKDKKLPPFTFHAMFRGTAHRQESKEMGMVMIMDEAKGVILSLNPKEQQAHLLQQINRAPDESIEGGFLHQMRAQLLGLKGDKRFTQRVSLGEREMADAKVVGYRISGPGGEFDVWGDQETGLPYSIVSNMTAFPNMEVTMTGFEFDVDLNDALFSLTPPAGYAVTRDTMDMSLRSEKGFLAALKQSAEINDGVYPDTIDMMVGIKLAKQYSDQLADKPEGERAEAVNRVRTLLAAGFSFPLQLSANTRATYAGKGVHRDDADKPIFWYQPEDAAKYRVVYASLSVVDAASAPRIEHAQSLAPPATAVDAD